MVHGRVLQATNNQEIQGIPNLTVSLVNRKGEWVQELGRACTDERGYFALIYPPQNSESTSPMPTEPVFLMVSDRDRRVLHRSSEPLLVKPGQIIYREIFLSDSPECSPPPDSETSSVPVKILSFHAPTQLTVNQSGNFRAQVNDDATPPVTAHWEFGDGMSTTGLTATHAYSTAGTYHVVFTATNSLGPTTRAQQVTVNPAGKAVQVLKLDVPSTLNVNQSGNFRAQINNDATPPVTSHWEFGDGSSATGLTATHVYSREGNYTVTFMATNSLGSDTRTSQVTVRQESPKRYKKWWLWFPILLVLLILYFFFRAQGYFI
jgi:PKD repeat protein